MQNRHRRILLQDLLRSRMWKCIAEPRVPEQKPKWENSSTAVQGLSQRNLYNSILWKMASSGVLVLQDRKWMQFGVKCSYAPVSLTNSLARSLQRMVIKLQWLFWRIHGNWVAYFRIWSRRSLHRFCGRAQTHWSQSDVFNSPKACYVIETKNRRLE